MLKNRYIHNNKIIPHLPLRKKKIECFKNYEAFYFFYSVLSLFDLDQKVKLSMIPFMNFKFSGLVIACMCV